ncbi:hypothetical protein ZIOFF_014080 [Zingiber officinale]|uniref:Cytochrome P450 86B1 n=1 Tax=Zingiber officinale TaxID=94328 RepID=A0A8J5LRD1_ZINOF|nr:hypothetical protein ZIOFF_014080 [Zingiber officinale]
MAVKSVAGASGGAVVAAAAKALAAGWAAAREHVGAVDLAVALLGLFVFGAAVQRIRSKGPMLWPVLGIIPTVFFHLNDIYEWATAVAVSAGGTFPFRGMWFGNCHGVITVDPATVEHVLRTRFANYPKGAYFRERFGELLGDGIFNADDQAWREQRRAATSEIHSARFAAYSAVTVADLVRRKLLPILSAAAAGGHPVDLQELLLRFTFDNICAAGFGVDLGCLAPSLPEVPFARALEDATELSLFRFIVPPFVWKLMRLLDVGTERRLKVAVRLVHKFAEKTLADRRAEFEAVAGGGNFFHRSDLLSRLIDAGGGGDGNGATTYSNKFLKDFCISFILAGRDTTSVALAWFFWLLSEHPRVESRVLHEIAGIIKNRAKQSSTHNDVVFSVEEVKKMEYLHAAISEAMRLYPPVPVDFKEALEDDVFPDGTAVRKGGRVIYSIYSMGRMESIWGADCREFKPERWMKGGGEGGGTVGLVAESQFKYAVFNAGPRVCVGKRFAYMQMKMVAAAILTRFRVAVVAGHPVAPKMTTTLYMKHGLRVTFAEREQEENVQEAYFMEGPNKLKDEHSMSSNSFT